MRTLTLRVALTTLLMAVPGFCSSSFAQQSADTAAFIIRLGRDTISVERYVRTSNQLTIEAVQRSPSTMIHRMVIDLAGPDRFSRAIYRVTQAGWDQPVLTRTVSFDRDSATVVNEQGGQTRTQRVAARDAVPMAGPFYTPYELAITRALNRGASRDTVRLLGEFGLANIPIERVGSDSVSLQNQFGEPMRAHVDARGRILHLHTPAFTTVERVKWLALDALSREFAARDASGRGMGQLSPRQAFRFRAGGANLWVDYSRPAARGRPLWGALIPFDRVWRMGANDAAHFATDRALDIGGVRVEPGTYTLFLLPTAADWTLIINNQTGMSGLDYDAAKDVGRVRLAKQTLSRPAESFTISVEQPTDTGGVLAVSWGDTKASVSFVVR